MRKLILSACLLVAGSAVASAADLAPRMVTKAPPAPVATWTGWYAGIQGGWGDGEANHTIIQDGLGFLNAPFGPTKIDGWHFGGVVGYDYQATPNWVFGINTEFNGADMKGLFDNGIPQGFGPGGDDIYESKVRWFGSVRGKVGYVFSGFPQLMIYGTGGLAYANIWGANGDGLDGFSMLDVRQGSGSKTKLGYVVGGGVSWMIAPNWILSGEGAYYDFGTARINTVTNTGATHIFDITTSFAVGRGVLTYKF